MDIDPGTRQVVCPQCDAVNRLPAPRLHDASNCGKCKQPLFRGHPSTLTDANFDAQTARSGIPVVVDFWAPWCGPCRAMAPAYEQAAQVLEPGIRLARLNTEDAPATAARFNIRSIPTLVLFRNGTEVARQSGALTGPALMNWIRHHA
jgi:thioredoxin 2